ncbi:MAG: SUMF1/EgtB/PvdO family nonheme iron enzyme [Syntrophales bacterium]|nr:SUMF1/EgtB/PvdO family nonheme iron enzyme [Syntrophales bacterium]
MDSSSFRKTAFMIPGTVMMRHSPTEPIGFPTPLLPFLLSALLLLSALASPAPAVEHRTALVIGNSAYRSGPLKNPVNDAADMAAALKGVGFDVTLHRNAGHQAMEDAIREFGGKLKRNRGVGLFYYAGHGMQIGGVNYLIPVGARVEKETDVKFQAVNADMILAEMENAENGMNIVLLDACRDNPFGRTFRSASRGLAIISAAPTGTFISYSTGANQLARDGKGRNSPYTKALLDNIAKPGLTISDVFMEVRKRVLKETGQTPWELSSLVGHFYFRPGNRDYTEQVVPDSHDYAMSRPPAPVPPSDGPITDSDTGMEFVFVKGGCYRMGDTFGDGDGDEKPVHEVCVNDFYIGKYEVTQGQWQNIMGNNPSYSKNCGDNCPVEQVSWNDAQQFISRLNSQSGKQYRLPTEAEWEYAARSGGKSEKYAGGNDVDTVAWYKDNSGSQTNPVGRKQPNGLGLYDMSGNVWEWCHDWYGSDFYRNSGRDNPGGPSSGSYRVLRGGCWNYDAASSRAAIRGRSHPGVRKSFLGFRLALPPGQ